MTQLLWNATPAELDAYAELDELAAQWKALADWERLERRRAVYWASGQPRTCTVTVVSSGSTFLGGVGGPGGAATFANTISGMAAPDETPPSTQRSPGSEPPPEEPFPLERRASPTPKRPSWFDFTFSPKAPCRSSGHADDDSPELPRP